MNNVVFNPNVELNCNKCNKTLLVVKVVRAFDEFNIICDECMMMEKNNAVFSDAKL